MTKLTIEQFIEQINNENMEYAIEATIITNTTAADEHGIVCEQKESDLCTGQAIYEFMHADDDFDGVFNVENVLENIEIMRGME